MSVLQIMHNRSSADAVELSLASPVSHPDT